MESVLLFHTVQMPVAGVPDRNRGGFLCESKLDPHFFNSLIIEGSQKKTEILLQNSVLKQAKMVSIYWRNNIKDTKKKATTISLDSCKNSNHL